MANYAVLKAAIEDVIKTNGNNEITGELLQESLIAMINSLGAEYQFVGVATIATNPGTPDHNVFYIAGDGLYTNFGATNVPKGCLGVFLYNGNWTYNVIDVTKYTLVNVNDLINQSTPFASAGAARSAIPQQNRYAGLYITYLLSIGEDTSMWVTEQFAGDDVDYWTDADKWQVFGPIDYDIEQDSVEVVQNELFSYWTSYFNLPANTPLLVSIRTSGILFNTFQGKENCVNLNLLFGDNTQEQMQVSATNTLLQITRPIQIKAICFSRGTPIASGTLYYSLTCDTGRTYNKTIIDKNFSIVNDKVTGLNQDLSDLSDRFDNVINGYTLAKSTSVTSGTDYREDFNELNLKKNQKIKISISAPSGTFGQAGAIANAVSISFHNSSGTMYQQIIVNATDYANEFILSQDTKYFTIGRGGTGVLASNTVSSELEVYERFPSYQDVADLKAYVNAELEDVDKEINGYTVTKSRSVTAGSTYMDTISDLNLKKGQKLRITISAPSGTFGTAGGISNAVSISLHNAAGTMYQQITADATNFDRDFILSQDTKYFTVGRGSTGVLVSNTVIVSAIVGERFPSYQDVANVQDKIVYVNPSTGNDNYDGSAAHPYKTIAKAIDMTGDVTTIYYSGTCNERINIKRKASQRVLRILGDITTTNIFSYGTRITSATAVSGQTNVFEKTIELSSNIVNMWLFQHAVGDVKTLISDADRLPMQGSRQYRCESTKLLYTTSLQAIINGLANNDYYFYYDSDAGKLYFSCPSTDLANHPIVIPEEDAVYGNDGTCTLFLTNLEFWYSSVNATLCHNSVISDCAVKFASSARGFSYMDCKNITFLRCEACATRDYSSSKLGDGFNAGGTVTSVKLVTARLIDCWAHDNSDDGYSDHQRCKTYVIRGLYENNGKAGVTPSQGAFGLAYNVISRYNYSGFLYTNNPIWSDPRGMAIWINCIAIGNTQDIGAGFRVRDANRAICINCTSIGNPVGYRTTDNDSTLTLYDCRSSNDTVVKSGNIVVHNTAIVE